MIHVIDNAVQELEFFQNWALSLNVHDTWYSRDELGPGKVLVDIAEKYFDISDYIGCEMHLNHHTPYRHYDKDELLWNTHKKLSFPLCGIVWYNHIDMEGGEIIFPEERVLIKPKTNRIVLFRGDLLHDGIQFSGVRMSVGINPWNRVPLKYQSPT